MYSPTFQIGKEVIWKIQSLSFENENGPFEIVTIEATDPDQIVTVKVKDGELLRFANGDPFLFVSASFKSA